MDSVHESSQVPETMESKEQVAVPEAEFTTRAVIIGALMGGLVAAANIYMGLKIGFTEGFAILSAVLCFAAARMIGQRLTMLENNIGQTLSSGAASMGIMVSVIPALCMLGHPLGILQTMLWLFLVSSVGVLFAVPLRRQFIVIEGLTFPTGTACATTIRALHAKDEGTIKQARTLGVGFLLSGLITWFRDAVPAIIPNITMFPFQIAGIPAGRLTLGFHWSPMLLSVGMLVGTRIGGSLLLGGLLGSALLGPSLVSAQIIPGPGHSQITHWTMWLAIPLMVCAGFVSLLLKGRTIVKTISSMKEASAAGRSEREFPFRLWLWAIVVFGFATALVMDLTFDIPFWMGLVALVLSFLLAAIAVRAYGETDISPIGTMGHATQIVFGGLAPGQTMTNVLTAGITAGSANTAVDMMQDLKAGHLLGSSPRKQIYAQFIGVFVGSLVAVPVFSVMVNAYGLGSEKLPAPAAVLWSGMAKLLSNGFADLPPYAWIAILSGSVLGVILALLENTRWKKYTPSPLGIGIGIVVPTFYCVTIFVGTVIGMILEHVAPEWAERRIVPLASGGIGGEAIMAVIIIALSLVGIL